MKRYLIPALGWVLAVAAAAEAVEHVTFRQGGKTIHVTGRLVTEAADGGMLLLDREGVLWAVQPAEIVERKQDQTPYQPLTAAALQARLAEELPGFRFQATANYLLCYNTSTAYAQWCGALYERLYRGFRNYWDRRGFELHDPAMPLVAIVFDTQASYEQYARTELGDAARNIVGYYSLRSNRVAMYDLTGTRGLAGAGGRIGSSAQINRLLMQPGAEQMVATIVHEATHQLAYNCGFHQRYADVPLWVSEGLAVYFETPDLQSSKGWNTIGEVNAFRLQRFRRYLATRPADSLQTLIADDTRFRQPDAALDAYAEAWALQYYLIRRHLPAYVRYLQQVAEKEPLLFDTPQQRLADFAEAFGGNIQTLDADFVAYMQTVR